MKKYLFSSDLCGIRRRKSLRIKDRLQRNKAAINAPKQDSVQRMVDREAKRAEGKGIGYDRWAAVHNLKQMAATMSIYGESGFSSPEELEAALAAASAGLHETTGKLKAVESTLREKKDLQKQLLAYIKTKPARDGLRAQKTEKARRAYREQHESEFIISESAARYFKAQGISKLPASKALQAEIEQLTREAVQTMLGFELAHVGVNAENEEEALKAANRFAFLFGMPAKAGSSSVFAGTALEVMKSPYLGKNGHIAVRTNYIDRAVNYLSSVLGVEFNEDSAKRDAKGALKAIYLKEEIGGFAVHLVQK